MKKNLVVFANCHGEKYLNILKRDTNINEMFNIKYFVSYQQLNNFSKLKDSFANADVLITNSIKKYDNFRLNNLKKHTKDNCLIIVIPFVRFEGYWLPENYKNLNLIKGNSVSYFPNINKNLVDLYLSLKIKKEIFIKHFIFCLKKLKNIEKEGDIEFFDFFIKNHKKYPFFRDNYHPTNNMIEYIADKILEIILTKYELKVNSRKIILIKTPKEYGHYKPICDEVKNILNLDYNLDSIFICSRKDYLEKILDYDNNKNNVPIKDLDDMMIKIFS